jgi:hypothetical protein
VQLFSILATILSSTMDSCALARSITCKCYVSRDSTIQECAMTIVTHSTCQRCYTHFPLRTQPIHSYSVSTHKQFHKHTPQTVCVVSFTTSYLFIIKSCQQPTNEPIIINNAFFENIPAFTALFNIRCR